MMDSKVSTPSSFEESTKEEDELQCKITRNQNKDETSEFYNTPASDIEAPLSPVLTNSKKSLRHIARRKSRIKLMSKFSQNSSESQNIFTPLQSQSQVEEKEQMSTISLTDNLMASVEIPAGTTEQQSTSKGKNEKTELEERMKRCIELQRKKKFCYNIAVSSSKSSSTSNSLESYDTGNSNFKITESLLTENKSCDSLKTVESFISPVNATDSKIENDFNFKIPESPVSAGKLKRARTEIMPTNLDINMDIGFETGSGKKIKLSKKALKRAAKLFDDIDISSDSSNILSSNSKNNVENSAQTRPNNSENISNVGFKTASGNTLKLSETSMNKIKTLFDDIYDLSNYKEIDVENNVKTIVNTEIGSKQDDNKTIQDNKTDANTKKSNETEFKTPSPVVNNSNNKANEEIAPDNKNVSCTQITDTQMCWAAENAECMAEFMNSQWTPSPKDKTQKQTTQHLNEHNINKSLQEDDDEFSSQESEQIFGNLTVCEDGTVATRHNQLDKIDTIINIPSSEFATIPEKEITKLEETSTTVMSVFQDCDNTDVPKSSSFGFTTASGKRVSISEDSLKNARNMFEDCDITEENLEKTIGTPKIASSYKFENNFETPNCETIIGFATASGKKVSISEDSLKKAKKMFQDCEIAKEDLNETPKTETSTEFATVSGKKVAVSEDSLKKAKNMFQDCDISSDIAEESLDKNIDTLNASSFEFATALDKNSVISEASLNNDKNGFQNCDIIEENTNKYSDILTSFETVVTLCEDKLVNLTNRFLDKIKENNSETPTSALLTAAENSVEKSENEQEKARTNSEDSIETKEETKKEISQQLLVGQEQKNVKSVPASTLEESLEDMFNKSQIVFEDTVDLSTRQPENEIQIDVTTPSTSKTVPQESINSANSENIDINEILPQSLTEHKNISNSVPHIDNKEESLCSDCCGFTWEESLKSLKIFELYKRSFKYIEKDIKTNVFYPLSFTFDDIQSSKEYKNKNYRYSLRSRKKSSVIYGGHKRKSTRGQRKSINSSPITPELLNTSSMVTRSKRNTITNVNNSLIGSSNTRSRTRKSKDNASNDGNISIGNNSDSNTNSLKSNSQKTIEDLEDAFLSCIENTLKYKTSQETSTATDSIMSADDIDNLKEVFSEETNFDTSVLPKNDKRTEQNSSDFVTPLEQPNIVSKDSLTSSRIVDDLEKTKIITDCPVNCSSSKTVMNSGIYTAIEKDLIVKYRVLEKMKHIYNECSQELENKITNNATPKSSICSDKNKYNKENNNSEEMLKKSNMFNDTEKENINNFYTPKSELKFGFLTASGKKIDVTDENLKKARNIFQDCDDLHINTPLTARNFGSEQKCQEEYLDKTENIIRDSNTELSVDNTETPKNLSSIGFSTASGKKVSISEESIKKVKNIFQDCDITEEEVHENIGTPETATSIGFATVSGKKVSVSEESLKKVKNIFQDCDIIEEDLSENSGTPKNATSIGFATASGKEVSVSEESLKKVKNIFQDCDITEDLDKNIDTPKNATSVGFATASGEKVAVPKESLKKVKNIFQDCDIIEEDLSEYSGTPKNVTSIGFATASGKKVSVSEESLKKVKNIFQDCDITEEVDKNIGTPRNATPMGFATASGKKVSVSEESLKEVKNIFQDCDIIEEHLDHNTDTPTNATSIGFATASGKKVSVSKESLKKVKNIFQDCDIIEEDLSENSGTPKNATSLGFATASGKKVSVTEESLMKVKNIFQDCDITEDLDKNTGTPKNATSIGFATASGKKVSVSEESLKKVQNIFQDCDITEEDLVKNSDTPKNATSFGFATASGKKVAISEDSLKKAKNIFQDCDMTEDNLHQINDTPKNSSSFGFATASGKKVSISEEALAKAKTIFDNETDKEQTYPDCKHVFEESFSTPTTSMKSGFSTASGNKVIISEEALNKVRNIFEDNIDSTEISHQEDDSVLVKETEKCLKKSRSISENCEENTRSEKNLNSIQSSKFKDSQKPNSSPAVTANKSYSSPQISTNDSTPILRNKTLSARNSKKRSLGVTSCRQIDIAENTMKRAKLIFDDIDSPKKNETTINNNHLQNYSPLTNKTNTPQNVVSRSTPNISTQNKSLLNSTITIKETNQQKITQNVVTPKISPIKKFCLGTESTLDNSSFVLQEKTSGDIKKWNRDLQKELEMLKLRMSVIDTRMQMLNKQQESIENGTSEHRRQRPGCLFTQKSNPDNRISLKTAVKNRRPAKNTHQICLNMGVDPSLLDITAENSSTLHFHVPWWPNDNRTYPAVIRTEDGAVVVPNQQNFIGVTEMERAFLSMPGVDPSLVPEKWVTNHFRWIVWKLASLERNYPDRFKNCLTVECVISQLKYRYDREIDRAQRPALKKIVGCDDTAAKRMVLCVATVNKLADNRYELELTDGWYSIITTLDVPLNSLVERNVIKVGMKLMTQGAELQNCEGCCPLELPSNVRLQINYNSTRRAAWHTKLGYQPNPGPLRISLRMIAGNGGPIGGVRAYVARVYPISFMERCDAAITWRNQRAELRRTIQWEAEYSNTMETIQMRVQQELEREWGEKEKKSKGKRLKIKNVEGVVCGETLFKFIEDSNDPDSVRELLTPDQISSLQEYQSQLNTERQAELTSRLRQKLSSEKIQPRNVSTVLKLLLVDVKSSYHHRMLSIWRPTETHTQILKEGLVINMYNVAAKNNGTLSSIPRTQFEVASDFDTSKFENINRFIIPISQIANPELKPQFGEFDTLGMVVAIDVQQTAQTLWLADENYRFLLIKIRESPETCCLFDGLTPGKIVAVLNLIHQKAFKSYGEAIANQYTVLSSYPQQAYLQDFMKEFIENLSEHENVEQYLEECKIRVEEFSDQNRKRAFVLNPLNINNSEEETEILSKKLCGIENTQQNKSDSLTLSDEEMALIDTQTM